MMEATEVVRAMHRRSDRTVLLADSGKWGQAGFARIIPLAEIDTLVIDSGLPESARNDIRALGVEILIAEMNTDKSSEKES
jgi:DeoR/GlpR family transcriptional regulator of sugar metabolism